MLRNRSKAVATKQNFMADHNSLPSPTKNPNSPTSSLSNSQRFFNGFPGKTFPDVIINPTSILGTKNPSSFVNPFGYGNYFPPFSDTNDRSEPEAVGLALIDSLADEKSDGDISQPISRITLFGTKLKVQIPTITRHPSSLSPGESPKSPADFGIKTKNSHFVSPFSKNPEKNFTRQLSLKEMELSEDYTCVITHGPNPKTTHIFDDCIVESDQVNGFDDKKVECGFGTEISTSPSDDFKSFCHTCKKNIEGKDICLYRGEKAFSSHDCRCQEMLFEGMNNNP